MYCLRIKQNCKNLIIKNKSKTILLIEDEPNLQRAVGQVLEKGGFIIKNALDGEIGVEVAKKELPSLILLDLILPKKDGFEVCSTLKSDERTDHIPVIMLTAKGREVEREKGMAMGADDYVTKPFSTRELTERVKALLEADAP